MFKQHSGSVLDLIQRWVVEQPGHEAISIGPRTVSYKQLDDAATRIACLLLQRHVRAGDFVPVLATRSIAMVACFLGVLKAGACYVPIDIEAWSEQRIAWTIDTVSARVMLNLGNSSYPDYDIISVSEVEAAFEPRAISPKELHEIGLRRSEIKPDDLAYMIFTSGTTSTPKGVMIPHSGLLHYVQQGDEKTPFNCNATPDDTILLIFSPGFDACVGVVFSALCGGAKLIISRADDLLECASRSTILVATPSVLAALGDPELTCPDVKTIILGGEAPPPALVEKWWTPNRNIFNAYGLTETTIMSTIGRVVPGEPVTLGQPMANTRVFLLDGEIESDDYGELCITGPGLAVGYYKNEALTAQKFITRQGERVYKTGDFARNTKNGLEFAGRADSLVKNRGFLVNLETQVIPMLLAGGASTATALMFKKQLIAFVTPKALDALALRQQLAGQLDEFMVPDQIRTTESLPLTTNGKADNRALQRILEQEDDLVQEQDVDAENNLDRNGQSRMDILKAAVATATSLPMSRITEDQSFWELGGNSLAAVKVVSYLRKRHLTIGLKALFGLPNLIAVCAALQDDPNVNSQTLQQSAPSSGPMSSLQVKMVQGSLRQPGLNYMLFYIRIPLHAGTQPDVARLRGAWHQVLQRHTVFRTTFSLKDETQEVRPQIELDWYDEETTTDQLESVLRGRSREIYTRLVAADDLSGTFQPVNALRLVTVPGSSSTLLFSVHHAQVDGWSLSIILNEVQAATTSDGAISSPPPSQFTTVSRAQKKQQMDPQGIAFWDERLKAVDSAFPMLELPKPTESKVPDGPGWMDSLNVPLELDKSSLEEAGRRFRIVPSALIYAAWGLMLSNYTSSDRLAFGAVLSGRNLTTAAVPDVERVVGPLINTVPFPVQFGDEKQTIADCLASIHKDLMDTVEYQWSANEVMAGMSGEIISSALQTIVVTEYDVPPMHGSWSIIHQDLMLEFGLSLLVEKDQDDRLQATLLFDSTIFAPASVRRLTLHFRNALREFMEPSNTHVQEVRAKLIGQDEKDLLIKAPAATEPYDGPRTVKEALAIAAEKWPDYCALESQQHGTMTYRELDKATNRLARQLRVHLEGKSRKDAVVCVLTDRSLHWIVGIVAVIKAGGICCPLDVTLPARRIEKIVETSGASIFLSASQQCKSTIDFRKNTLAGQDDVVITIDEFLEASADLDASPLETITKTEDIIYLVFTSGTSGIPKGVPLHNLSILHVIDVPSLRLFAEPGRRIAQLTSAGFDIAILEMFGTLCYGATLVLKDASDPFAHLQRVHASNLTPSVLAALLPENYTHLDMIALAGEPVPQSMADAWAVGRDLRNVYGPSECGPVSTTTRLHPGTEVTIGPGLPRLSIYVLDHHRCPVPQGITGEIYISGEQITRGYWKNSGRNQNRHIENPFSSSPGMELMYRTGDLGSWNEDMTLSYRGRIDHQVKVRGFRVELEEIEHAILAADLDIRARGAVALVVDSSTQEGNQDDKRIVAFVTPQDVDAAALRAQIATVLPSYMRPSQLFTLSALPRSQNGKADREALRSLAVSSRAENGVAGNAASGESLDDQDDLTPTEYLVKQVWCKLLGLNEKTVIRKEDDFLSIGGNSILAIKAARMIASSVGQHVPLALLIRKTVLQDLAEAIDQQVSHSVTAAGKTFSAFCSSAESNHSNHPHSKMLSLSYLEEELFHWHNTSDTKSAFNTVFQFIISGAVNQPALVEAFKALVRENPILRSRYVTADGRTCRLLSDRELVPRCYKVDEWSAERTQALVDEPFDLANDHLLRVVIWDRSCKSAETEVILVTHHIVTDRASIALMVQWVSSRYRQITGQEHEPIEGSLGANNKSHTKDYLDWVQWLQGDQDNPLAQAKVQKKLAYWKKTLRGMKPLPQMHQANGTSRKKGQHSASTQHIDISRPNDPAATTYSQRLAVASVALALRAVLGTSDIVLALPYMNRDDPSTADMLGLFVDRLPLRLAVADNNLASAEILLNSVAVATHRAIENQMPYKKIQAALADQHISVPANGNFVDVLVIYNWQTDALERAVTLGPELQVLSLGAAEAAKPRETMIPLLFNFCEQEDGSLVIEVESNPGIIPTRLVDELLRFLPGVVKGLASHVKPETLLRT
ncbi:Nonribosomal peptide synthetase 5 [Cytospora mali]|uniref:Nonribosomal peptide synthetase 5 n=1 Tax=Cytospora mali TaxID=578113 RepID=A0A194W5G0_CYTMA|nr:Nonribosomal peptide synthetase 5 [Valsa mali]